DGKHQPDDRLTKITGHPAQHGQVTGGPLEGRRQFLVKALPYGLLPGDGGRRVEQFEPACVVVAHPADELVEDVEPVDSEGEYGPAQRRPVAEDIVGLAPALRRQADPLSSGRRWRA